MSKKTLILISCLVLSLALGLGGSLAYLTDTDTRVNTFTMGDVNIKLDENFEQGSTFVPGKDIVKEAWIENTGSNEAYVWMTVALPLELEGKTTASAADNIVHINTPGAFWYGNHTNQNYWATAQQYLPALSGETNFPVADGHTWQVEPVAGQIVKIDGVDYWVMTYWYNSTLVPGEKTNLAINKVYLDAKVDFDPLTNEYYYIDGGVKTKIYYDLNDVDIYLTAYAIQADGFNSVKEAYEAYMGQWTADAKLTSDMITGDGVVISAPETGAVRPAGYIPQNEGETIDNLVVKDNSGKGSNLRAIYNGEGGEGNYLTGDLTITNSKLDGTYAMNLYAVETETVNLVVEKTTLAGWVSYTGFDTVTFTDCTFTVNSEDEYNFIRPYDTTVFTNCNFVGTTIGLTELKTGEIVTFENCTWNGQPVDAYLLISDIVTEGTIANVLIK